MRPLDGTSVEQQHVTIALRPARSSVATRRLGLIVSASTAVWVALAAVVALVYAAPSLHYVLAGTNVSVYYSENIGYRYFMALRAIDASDDLTHPGQGPLLGLIQQVIYVAQGDAIAAGLGQFVNRLNAFAYATSLVNGALMALIVLSIALDRRLSNASRIALIALPLFFEYTWYHGFMLTLYPDYYPYGGTVVLAATYLVLRGSGVYALALVTALSASLKIVYGAFPFLVTVAFLYGSQAHRWKRQIFVFVASAGVVYLATILLYYRGSLSSTVFYFQELLQWGGGISGDPSFFALFFDASTSLDSQRFGTFWWMLAPTVAVLVGIAVLARRSENPRLSYALVCACALSIAFGLYFIIRRSAGTSIYDLYLIFAPSAVLALAAGLRGRPREIALTSVAAVCVAVAIAWTQVNQSLVRDSGSYISQSADNVAQNGGFWNEQMYEWNLSKGTDIVLLMPSNQFIVGSVEDMMMRGLAQILFGSWYTSNKDVARERFFPRYHFISYDSTRGAPVPDPEDLRVELPKRYVFVWTYPISPETPGPVPPQQLTMQKTYLETQGYFALLQNGADCRQWDTGYLGMRAYACLVES